LCHTSLSHDCSFGRLGGVVYIELYAFEIRTKGSGERERESPSHLKIYEPSKFLPVSHPDGKLSLSLSGKSFHRDELVKLFWPSISSSHLIVECFLPRSQLKLERSRYEFESIGLEIEIRERSIVFFAFSSH